MSEVRADQPAMRRFATSSMDRRDEFDQLRARMDAMRLPRKSFGYIPGIGDRVHHAYEEFVGGLADAVSSAAETMASVASAVRGAAGDYASSDHGAADALRTIESELAGTDLRGLR